jgi:hypothetical protein
VKSVKTCIETDQGQNGQEDPEPNGHAKQVNGRDQFVSPEVTECA